MNIRDITIDGVPKISPCPSFAAFARIAYQSDLGCNRVPSFELLEEPVEQELSVFQVVVLEVGDDVADAVDEIADVGQLKRFKLNGIQLKNVHRPTAVSVETES